MISDTGDDEPYWATSADIAVRYGISSRAVRKNVARHDLGCKVARDCGGLEWMAALPLYEAWQERDTGATCDERRTMEVLAERLLVP